MDVVLPYRIRNEQKFFECAFKLGFDEMSVHKFLYMFHQSDVDTFPKMGDDRITVLIYGWELCEDYRLTLNDDEWELPEEIEVMLKVLVPWSLDVWFSREWDRCKVMLRYGLIHCLNRARGLLMRSPDMMQINWEFLLLYNQTPWQVPYLKSLNVKKEKTLETGGQTIEMEELPPTTEDLNYTKLEQFPMIVLRLVKLFDQGSIDMVKTLCMRVLAAWNKIYHTELETAGSRLPYVPPEDKRCLLLICHIYLMAVYEADDVKGYVIDNMINNIRFYYQSFQTNTSSYAMDNLSYTPARFIALTSIHLRLQKRELFDFFIWNSSESSPVNLFGVVSQAYKSYLLGNLLMELNNMNDDYFASNSALYKRLMNSYVNEREKSEIFMIGEMQKLEAQRYAHNIQNPLNISDFKSKICKGNRMSNIGNYENTDDMMIENKDVEKVEMVEEAGEEEGEEREELWVEENENELSVDPIFQNIPNNEEVLYYVYDVLSKKSYRGWQFAKIVLLFKIISHELNMLETWRYHPGLTINFMLNLETKLSQHYIDLAKIFKDYAFMEQEFWLTAFYLNPSQQSYEAVKRLGIRNNRKRNEEPTKWTTGRESIEAKYGLLSSTIDVKEIVVLTNADDQNADYVPLTEALHSLHLPDSVIKDILTVIFLPRNKGFSWAVEWNDLRRRCKMLMNNTSEKKRCVELTMAEANDRLKFLNIDYAKYKNRPQLDYGSIEQGYENLTGDLDGNSDESEDEEDFEDDEDVYESQKGNTRSTKKQEEVEVVEDDNSQEDDPYLIGRRRTRARTAAAMASLLCTSEMTTRRKRRQLEEEMSKEEEKETDNEEKSNDSKITEIVVPIAPSVIEETTSSDNPETQKRNIKECLKERPLFLNSTEGFRPLIDMWNIEKSELQAIDVNCVSLLESSSILSRFAKLKSINKQNNPMSTNEEEQIDQVEMVIKHEKTVPKLEKIPENKQEVVEMHSPPVQAIKKMDKVKEPEEEKPSSELVLESKPQTTQEEDKRTKSEDDSEKKAEVNNDSNSCQKSQPSGGDSNLEIDQDPITMPSDSELTDNNMEIEQEPVLMQSGSELIDNNMEFDQEPILTTSDSVLRTDDIVGTDMGDETINECPSPIVPISELQESLPESSSHKDSTNADLASGVAIDEVTDMDVNDTADNKAASSEISVIDSNENKSVAEEKHITDKLALTSLSSLVPTESNLAEEATMPTDDTLEMQYLSKVDENQSANQVTVDSSDSPDNRAVLENATSEINTEHGKVVIQETYTEQIMPKIASSDLHEIERTTKAVTPSDQTKETDTEYEEVKSVSDDTPTSKIETDITVQDSVENTAAIDKSLQDESNVIRNDLEDEATDITESKSDTEESSSKSNFGMSSTDKPLQDEQEEIKTDLEDAITDITENKSATEESSSKSNFDKSLQNEPDEIKTDLVDATTDITENKSTPEESSSKSNFGISSTDKSLQGESHSINTDLEDATTDITENISATEESSSKSNIDIDKPLEDKPDDIKTDLENELTEITENKFSTEESSDNIIEADIVVLDSKGNDTTNEEMVDMSLPDLDIRISAIEEGHCSKNNEADISQCSEEIKSVTNATPSSESGAMEPQYSKDELLPVVEERESAQKDEATCNTSEIDIKLLSSEEINTVTNEVSAIENETGISSMDGSENTCTNVEEPLADESIVDKPVEVIPDIAITADISPVELETDINAVRPSELAAGIPSLESEENKFDDTPVNNRGVNMPSPDLEVNKSVISTAPDQKSEINIPVMGSDDCKHVVDETNVDLLSMEKDDTQSEEDKIFNNKKSDDMPSLYSDESKSVIDYNLSQAEAVDMPTLDSEESKDGPLAQKLLRNDSRDSATLQAIKEENNTMKNLCIARPLRVLIRKLRPCDLVSLRQPRVRVKRIRDVEAVVQEVVVPKRTRLHRRVYVDVDESSDSLMSNSSTSSMYRPPGRQSKAAARRNKLRQNRPSDSDCDSNNSFHNMRKRCMGTPNANSNHSNNSAKSSSRASTATSGNLVVIPRSASGLKLRISHAEQKPALTRPKYEPVIVVDEIIQVSSSSNDESNTMDSVVEVPEDEPDPLYEEAVIELHKPR